MTFCLKRKFGMVLLWVSILHELWFHGNSNVHGEATKTKQKINSVPRL